MPSSARITRRLPVVVGAALAVAAVLPLAGSAAFGTNGVVAFRCGTDLCIGSSSSVAVNGAVDPAWSPDGSKLAYVKGGQLYVQSYSNGTLGTATPLQTPANPTQPTWGSDGLRVAYVAGGSIYVSTASGSGDAVLTTPATMPGDPAWAPDGSALVYARPDSSGHDQVYAVALTYGSGSVTAGTEHPLTSTLTGDNRQPEWYPDSSELVFASTRDGGATARLYTMSPGGANQTELGTGIAGAAPDFSPDGTEIVFDVPTAGFGAGPLDTVAYDGSGTPTRLDSGASDAHPAWQTTTSSATSTPSSAPTNTSWPTIVLPFGATSPKVGQTLSATVGGWSGTLPIAYTYEWKKCEPADPVNSPCFHLPGQTSSSLTITPDLYGWRIRVAVTATNSYGSGYQNSAASDVVGADPPRLTVTPPITGGNTVGQTLSVASGTWQGAQPMSFAYEWRRCDPPGTLPSCNPIPGATATSYTPTPDDIGWTLRVYITATNVGGSVTGITNHTFPIVDRPHFAPTATTSPAVAGTPQIGRQLTATTGVFSGDLPITTSFVWQRCDATGADCHTIPHARKLSYSPTEADVGSTIRLSVTAVNAYGKLVALSQPSEPVTAEPPHVKGLRIVGTAKGDYLFGTPHDDTIYGLAGNDTINGDGGYDTIYGGPGNDVITVPGPGGSRIDAGPGSDTIYAANGFKDVIDCGPGNDRAVVDPFDVVKNCEVVVRVAGIAGSGTGGTGTGGTGKTAQGAVVKPRRHVRARRSR